MDQGTLQGIGTLLAMIAFVSVCVWAYSDRKKKDFDEAAKLPFEEGELESHENDEKKAG